MWDIRQGAGAPQCEDTAVPNPVTVSSATGVPVAVSCYGARTLDLYPQVPEFLHVCEIVFPAGMAQDDELRIDLGREEFRWTYPAHPIGDFRFWLAEGKPGQTFALTGYKTYRKFRPSLSSELLSLGIAFAGEYPRPDAGHTRKTPGILWGDLHGMVFNQRPLDEYYAYARDIACFDFAAAMVFSYNICVGDIWESVKETAARWTRPGEFVAVTGIEFGTPPDGSHRNAHFFLDSDRVPPIFFEERPPALDPDLVGRFHPDTVFCRDLADFYATIERYRGVVSGHFHTLKYDREILAEMWQKQAKSAGEERRIFDLLNDGIRLGLVAGSDTHDSMPGNPFPEPGCPQPAGFMAVLTDEISLRAIYDAVIARRVYGTTGARIALNLDVSGRPMGSVVPATVPRWFRVQVEGTAPLAGIELLRQGAVVDGVDSSGTTWDGILQDPSDTGECAWYLIRVTQKDGHRAWSSPVWFD